MRLFHRCLPLARSAMIATPLLLVVRLAAAELIPGSSGQNVLLSPADEHPAGWHTTGSEKKSPFDDGFRQFVEGHLEKFHVPGMAVAVVDGDQTWAEGYGLSELPSTPMTNLSLFYTGSTTKAFTASSLAMMVDSGNYSALDPLGLRTPIASIIPGDFVLQDPWNTAHLTLEDALSHRTGYPRHDLAISKRYPNDDDNDDDDDDGDGSNPGFHNVTPRDLTRVLRHLPQVLDPRTEFRYCNLMFVVAAHVVETLTGGRWLGDTLRDWIWTPLGMDDTYFDRDEALRGHSERGGPAVATGYWWDYPAEQQVAGGDGGGGGGGGDGSSSGISHDRNLEWFHEAPKQSSLGLSGAGAIISNVVDYAKWIRCLLNEAAPLPKSAHAAIKQPRMVMGSESKQGYDMVKSYALGLWTTTYRGHQVFLHSGGVEAYGANLFFFPDLGYGVVTMANTAGTSNVVGQIAAWQLINDRMGVPDDERWDWIEDGENFLQSKLNNHTRNKALQDLFPDRPTGGQDPPLPRALPLEKYTGTYHNPGYQNLTITQSIPTSSSSSPLPPFFPPSSSSNNENNEKKNEPGEGRRRTKEEVMMIELWAPQGSSQAVWETTYKFHHVSGEFWFVSCDFDNADNGLMSTFARAEFHIGGGVGGEGEGGGGGGFVVVDAVTVEYFEDGWQGVIRYERVE